MMNTKVSGLLRNSCGKLREKLYRLARYLVGLSLAITILQGPVSAETSVLRNSHLLQLGTASASGVYWPIGNGICSLVNASLVETGIRCLPRLTGGSVYNIQALRAGHLDLAITRSDLAAQAATGSGNFEKWGKFPELRTVLGLYVQPVTVLANSGIALNSLSDFEGKRIAVGKVGSGQRNHVNLLLRASGLDNNAYEIVENLTTAEMREAFCEGLIDILVQAIAHPSPYFSHLIKHCSASVFSLQNTDIAKVKKIEPSVEEVRLPRVKYYENLNNVRTYAHKAILVSTSWIPPEAIRTLVDAIILDLKKYYDIHESLAPDELYQMSVSDLTVPVHEGAIELQSALTAMHGKE